LILAASHPALAQLYSYRNAEGQLVITDKPIKEDGYKLKDVFVPKRMKEPPPNQSRFEQRNTAYRLTRAQIDGLVVPIAKSMNVDPDLVRAVIYVESSGDARAYSHKNAMGLMQLIPATAKRFGVENPYDPRQNVRGGVMYLRWLLSYFEADVDLALAGYNAGENAVDRHGGVPPYKETRRYIWKIRRLYGAKTLPFDEKIPHRSKLIKRAKLERAAEAAGETSEVRASAVMTAN
jgi:hypothetical protein